MKFFAAAFASVLAVGATGCSSNRTTALPIIEPQELRVPHSSARGRFTPLASQAPVKGVFAALLTDGTVLVQSGSSWHDWYRYAPSATGDYASGTWKKAASLKSNYGPGAAASQVLADGRFAIVGGEYNEPANRFPLQLTNLGAVYDSVANTWTPLGHPHGWQWIGDSPSAMLPGGQLLLGQKLTERDAALDPQTLQWTAVSDAGKADFNAEEGWTLLRGGTILTVDVKDATNSEIYDPVAGSWKSAGSTVVDLAAPYDGPGCVRYGPAKKDCYYPPGEIGPAMLRPDGTVFAEGAAEYGGTGHTAIYHTRGSLAGTWSVGPDFPSGIEAGDSYAALEPSGNVLAFAGEMLLEFDGKNLTSLGSIEAGPPLLLPTGQILILASTAMLYTPAGSPQPAWRPAIKSYPKSVVPGQTYKVTGTQFTGLSQAMAYGDEFQNATSYPLVRITNNANKHVTYARTHDHSTMAIATGSKLVWTYFDVPAGTALGASKLVVVANGIASNSVNITVASGRHSHS